jgi:hypothetical protein
MPMNRELYPGNWKDIARSIKAAANWRCIECDRPCRESGESWRDFNDRLLNTEVYCWYAETYDEEDDINGFLV